MGNPVRSAVVEDLHIAARAGDLNAVQSICFSNLLAINCRDKHSRTPLHLAAWAGHMQVVTFLCKHKADVGAAAMDDMSAIHFASQKGHWEVVQALVSSGASVKARTRKGFTPLHYAVQGSHVELIKYLVKKGASLDAKTKAGKSPLDLASTDDVRRFLVDCEASSRRGDEVEVEHVQGDVEMVGEEKGEEFERKREGRYENGRQSQTEKRQKVPLAHLLPMDDTAQ